MAAGRGGLAFLLARNTAGAVASYLACVEAGCAVVLLDARTPQAQLQGLLERYRPELVLAVDEAVPGPGYRVGRGAAPARVRLWWRTGGEPGPPVHPELAVLLSTSGSTGSPKLVRLTRRNLESNAESIGISLGIGPDERAVASLPIHYSYGLSVVNSHLLAGASAVLTEETVVSPGFWKVLRQERCTSMPGVPYTYDLLLRIGFERLELPSLRALTQAGGRLAPELVRRFHAEMSRRGGRFHVMYGQTEATARIACLPWDSLPEKAGAVGLAIPGGRLSVDLGAGASTGPQVPGEPVSGEPASGEPASGEIVSGEPASGEIVYTGPNVMMGYAESRDDLALGDQLHGVLRTGDQGYLDEEGFLHVTGRTKRIGKVLGMRVSLDEVEARLRPNGPTAVVAGDDGLLIYCEYGEQALFAELARRLASEMRATEASFTFLRLAALPLNANGKVDYQRLPRP